MGDINRSQAIAQNLHGLSDEQLLQLVVAGRAERRGKEWDTATRAWRQLAARHYDRLRGLVVAFRFPGTSDVRIGADDYDDATQECFIRAVKMLGNFRGTTLGEFLGALRTCVKNTCMDFCRRRLTRERGIAGSTDEPAPGADDETLGRFDAALGKIASRQDADHVAARDALAELSAGIKELENEEMREVLRRKMSGCSSREIADELELTVANVDQLGSRGVRKLKEVISDG
jgi:RNA polymerase sigma factor (sigma-70 family)